MKKKYFNHNIKLLEIETCMKNALISERPFWLEFMPICSRLAFIYISDDWVR